MASEFYLTKGLTELGHEVTIYTSDLPAGRYQHSGRVSDHLTGTKSARVVRCFSIFNLGGDLPVTPTMLLKSSGLNADVVHAHEYYNFSSLAACLAARRRRLEFTFSQERYYDLHRAPYRPAFSLLEKLAFGRVVREAHCVSAFSTEAKAYLKRKWRFDDQNILLLPMCTDTKTLFRPCGTEFRTSLNIPEDEKMILSVARLHPSKGLRFLLRAFAKLLRKFPATRLVIVGDGPERTRIEHELREFGLTEKAALYTKRIAPDDMPKVYSACDIYVQPSLWETFGLSVVEAMACRRPVIASDVGGMRDLIEHGVNGLRVEPGNSNLLARSLAWLIERTEDRKRIAERALERASRYHYERVAREYEQFYEIIQRR